MSQEKLKVLLIEHDSGFARYVGEMSGQARELSADVVPAGTLGTSLAALDSGGSVDLVLMDISLLDGAGIANVSLIRALAPHLPVIIAGESAP